VLYKKINRPHPETSFERLIQGLTCFRQTYKGKLWVEVMLVEGLNDDRDSLEAIAEQLALIQPDEIHLNLPTRPPSETWVKFPDEGRVRSARRIIESKLGISRGKTIRVVLPTQKTFNLSHTDSLSDAVLGIITRHPIQEGDLLKAVGDWSAEEIKGVLKDLKTKGQVQIVERHGYLFWTPTPAFFPDDLQSQRTAPED
jgi:wyosine [tRNA(Phe)-imidazoG37] synthetase (radical SAM superfamily)